MDTGYPALISDSLTRLHELQAQKTTGSLVPDESPVASASSEPTGSPPAIANAP